MRALKFMLCSIGYHLTISTLMSMVALDRDRQCSSYVDNEYVLGICSNLIILDEDNHAQFAHLSVREYLESSPQVTEALAHEQVAMSCLTYLTHHEVHDDELEGQLTMSFDIYATVLWALYCKLAGERRKTGDLKNLLTNFLLKSPVSIEDYFVTCSNLSAHHHSILFSSPAILDSRGF